MDEKARLAGLTLEQKVGQLFFIGISGPALDDATKALLDDVAAGGVCLFARNIRDALQTRALLDGVREYLPVKPLLSVDQEGGSVDRLRRIMTPMPAANRLRNAADAAELGSMIGENLAILGFNMDFAPVIDVTDDPRSKYSNGLVSRTFGKSKEDVAALAGEFLNVLQSRGIIGCLKHFPGLGASQVDSHEELPVVDIEEEEFAETDLFPYRGLLATGNVHALMVAHAAFPKVRLQEKDQNGKLLPSSLSKNFITTLLRGELAFDGLVITDDLEMGAIVKNYGVGEACKMAINAGVDMLAICADPKAIRDGYKAVLSAVRSGEIAEEQMEESLIRISRLKQRITAPAAFDQNRLEELTNRIASLNARLT